MSKPNYTAGEVQAQEASNQEHSRKSKYTPLGELVYSSDGWKRKKLIAEFTENGISYNTLRAYLTRVKGFRVPADYQKIILAIYPEAEECFQRPKKDDE